MARMRLNHGNEIWSTDGILLTILDAQKLYHIHIETAALVALVISLANPTAGAGYDTMNHFGKSHMLNPVGSHRIAESAVGSIH